MWLFPFKSYYLSTTLNREQIHKRLLDLTYLSDETYKKTDSSKKYFYGTLSSEDFEFQSISEEHRLVPYIEGKLRGADYEMYVFLDLKTFRMRRLYMVFLAFIIFCTGFAVSNFIQFGSAVFSTPAFLLFLTVALGLCFFLAYRCYRFWKVQAICLDFFRGLLDAETIAYADVPVVFKM